MLDARPGGELIPGAVVVVVATVHDDGERGVDDVRLRVTVPADVEPVEGSFTRGELAVDGEALLGEGLRLGGIPAGGAAAIRFTLRVLPGTAPLDVLAFATAADVPAIAGPALRLRRRAGHAAYEAQRPFFELEPHELGDDTAATAPPANVLSPPPAPPLRIDAMLDEPIAVPLLAPEPAEPVRRAPAERNVLLVRAIDADEAHALERVFAGALPHGLAALALLSAIACTDGPLGDALGLGAFARSISAALPRALVAARMNRPTPAVVTREALDAIRPDAAAPDGSFASDGPALVARLDPRELDLLRAVLGRDLADPFLRGVQLLLAVVPRALDGVPAPVANPVRDALAAYRIAAGSWLMRVTVRRAVDKRYDPLTADDATLHAAGRALVASLRTALP